MKFSKIQSVPTNVITGFLGVGKTTTILNLLRSKPEGETWAILVNEFGEVGIDGSIIQASTSSDDNVYVREVPGGCMCCASSLPMQVALTQLIRRSKPDRLLIEPTGLGHPKEVLSTLQQPSFTNILDLQKVITLVDARQLTNDRVLSNDTFVEQIEVADLIVANKSELYTQKVRDYFMSFLKRIPLAETVDTMYTSQGKVDLALLDGQSRHAKSNLITTFTQASSESEEIEMMDFPDSGIISAENFGDGFASSGWRFDSRYCFNKESLDLFFSGLAVNRVKAVVKTNRGSISYNMSENVLTEIPLGAIEESRIEIIAQELDSEWHRHLIDALVRESSI